MVFLVFALGPTPLQVAPLLLLAGLALALPALACHAVFRRRQKRQGIVLGILGIAASGNIATELPSAPDETTLWAILGAIPFLAATAALWRAARLKALPARTLESCIEEVNAIPAGTPSFDLLIPPQLTLRGEAIPQSFAMAVIGDAVLGAGFMPAGFVEERGVRRYRYEAAA